jgi:beta-glucosidase
MRLSILFICIASNTFSQQKPWIDFNKNGVMDVYENPNAEIDKRVYHLLSLMSVSEKMNLLTEVAPAIPRLGVAKYDHGNEALHGVVRPGKFTVFPQAIGMAATWNPILIQGVATVISDEARARWNELEQGKKQIEKYTDLLTFWSPTVNMARDPRWGRTPETYGEDPYLTSEIGVAFVTGLQGDDARYLKVVATPKHFAANNEEHNRFECKAVMSERALRSYYLPAFKALITEGKAQSIMTAYNAINGVPCTANKMLLTDILRNEWGFNGYIVSDCGAPGFLYTPHNYAPTREDAAAMAMKAGLDLECGGYCSECFIFRDYLPKAFEMGKVTESEITSSAFRVLQSRFKLGLFDDPSLNPYAKISPTSIGSAKHQDLALETARQSIVLLKNQKNILPLNTKKVKSIAVFGINAFTSEFGDYSGIPLNDAVSPLQGIINKVGKNTTVKSMPWFGKMAQHEIIPSNAFRYNEHEGYKNGLRAEYFTNPNLEGNPVLGTTENILFDPNNQPPNPIIPPLPLSIRWTGNIVPGISGTYMLGIKKLGGCKLYLNDSLLIDHWWNDIDKDAVTLHLEAGKSYSIKMEYACRNKNAYCALSWKTPDKKNSEMNLAEKSLARKSDVAIVVLGVNKSIEMEGRDRTSLDLPEDQQQFIQDIYKANPKTIVVLIAGSSLSINWIQQNIPAIVNAWYPGEQGGNAIADVLFGTYNPAGRLPLTYYKATSDLPAFNDYEVFNGRTYMYFDKKPLYAFGYGLSYTTFNYTNISVDKSTINRNDTLTVSVDVTNTGKHDGDEVIQLYLQHGNTPIKLPYKELKDFKRITVQKGETQRVQFSLSRQDLSYWNEKNEFILDAGPLHIQIGASSDDIRGEVVVTVRD